MKLLLKSGLYSALLCLAVGLQCFTFRGLPDHASQEQKAETCDGKQQYCSSTFITYSGILHGGVLVKECSFGETCNRTHIGSLKHIETSQTILCCDKDLCNQDLVPDLGEDYRTECLACQGPPKTCGGNNHPSMRCGPSQKSCIEVSITNALSQDIMHSMIKSCSNTSACPGLSAFSNGQKPVSYASTHHCCNGSQCNGGEFTDEDPGEENGLECYSRPSPEESGTMRCKGQMTQCMDLIGSSPDDVVMSGCATEAFCQGLYPHFKMPGWESTQCCAEALCNHGNNGVKKETHHDS
ncbi:urokinase plasminogen activator surface receptor-like [Hyla sarda]|uniref:urokinase plasminogen activator surface receptor-like n=1 Tax=Hyla sarda TaxID=327740 RepID=UPI0024C3AA58|nr:urokinase plasminogen activator surface receptor-like [Hyla sarda]